MKLTNLKKYERSPAVQIPADTAEEIAAFIAELVSIGEKLPNNSISGESLAQILTDYKKPREIIVNDVSGNRISVCNGNTQIISGGESIFDEKKATFHNSPELSPEDLPEDFSINTGFSNEQLELLRRIEENA